ncbi:secretory phospholipase A2 receptor-like [Plodia interpunctella]|uniref:secretory phospholipase A2 receptor-like n=1 Tax=Plodia interpunctella TaxID=58824 RepID=UPI002368D7B5|nr:secretory phospholipase A2 receptor-like [Plodia interpunctella]
MLIKIFALCLGISLSACRQVPFYRKDYTYIAEFDAFYKLHYDITGLAWDTAFFACEKEGSQLFYPKAPEEWKIVNKLIESKGLTNENVTDIFVGIRNEGIDEFITIDGVSTPTPLFNEDNLKGSNLCTAMDIANGSLNVDLCSDELPKPYVCKKVEDISCPTIDKGYNYVKETKKCYKVNRMSQSWHEALNTCVMEGGLLANIESQMEALLLSNLIDSDSVNHVGYRKIPPSDEFYNLKGRNIKDAYHKYYNSNSKVENSFCGTIWKYGDTLYLNNVLCNEVRPFICEMDVV